MEEAMEETPSASQASKRKSINKGTVYHSTTLRTPPHAYLHLSLLSPGTTVTLDGLTVRKYLTSALVQFLGLTGSAISVDILKVEGDECWIRVPREDCKVVVAAVGGWIGTGDVDGEGIRWRVLSWGNWLSSLVRRRGEDAIWDS